MQVTSSKCRYSDEYFETEEWTTELSEARRQFHEALGAETALKRVMESGDVPVITTFEFENRQRLTRMKSEYFEALLALPTSGTHLIIWMDKWQT